MMMVWHVACLLTIEGLTAKKLVKVRVHLVGILQTDSLQTQENPYQTKTCFLKRNKRILAKWFKNLETFRNVSWYKNHKPEKPVSQETESVSQESGTISLRN